MSETSNYKTKRRVIISGSTSGLGKEIALGLAKRGWTVAGVGQTKNKVNLFFSFLNLMVSMPVYINLMIKVA